MSHKPAGFIAIGLLLTQVACTFGTRDSYSYIHEKSSASGPFAPAHYIRENTFTLPLLLIFFDFEHPPHDLVLTPYDPTYLRTDAGFESFVLDTMQIEYANGTTVPCLYTPFQHRVTNRSYADRISLPLPGVLTRREDFTLHMQGTATKTDGTRVPFRRKHYYRYDGRKKTFHTLLDTLANC